MLWLQQHRYRTPLKNIKKCIRCDAVLANPCCWVTWNTVPNSEEKPKQLLSEKHKIYMGEWSLHLGFRFSPDSVLLPVETLSSRSVEGHLWPRCPRVLCEPFGPQADHHLWHWSHWRGCHGLKRCRVRMSTRNLSRLGRPWQRGHFF